MNMSDIKKEADELEALFKTFDKKFGEVEQKFSELEKNLEESRKEKVAEEQ
jgi:Skp family chaperone for outer membrane proteins